MITQQQVAEMIEAEAVTAVLRTYPDAYLTPGTGKVTPGTLRSQTVRVTPPNADGTVAQQYGAIDGVQEAKLFSMVAAAGLEFEPAVGQEFVWEGQTWVVTWVNPIRASTGVLAYQFGLRGRG